MNGKSVKLNSTSICAEEEVSFFFLRCAEFAVFMSFVWYLMILPKKPRLEKEFSGTYHVYL